MSELPPDPSEDAEALAAEHALGVLDGQERETAERREMTDATFASAVEGWRLRLASLLDSVEPIPAPASLWPSILKQLSHKANVVELRLRRSLAIWRGATGLAACIAAGLAVVVIMPRPEKPSPVMTSRISGEGTAKTPVVFVAIMDPAHHRVILQPVTISSTPGRSPELWLIAGGKPEPLGMATFDKPVQLKLLKSPTGAEVLAVSLEPEGGSPTGLPTGPVVATGKLQPV